MKRIQNVCLMLLLFAACNNTQQQNTETVAAAVVPETKAPEAVSVSCDNLILFHKGAVIEGANYDAAGKELGKQTSTVTDVITKGGLTEAHVAMVVHTPKGDKPMNVVYKCDGKNLYIDINSMMQNFQALKDTKAEISAIQFPLNVSEGQTLPGASYSFTMNMGGRSITMKTNYKNRTVGPRETITTPAGSWKCYKVNSEAEIEAIGGDERMKGVISSMKDRMKTKMIMWYTPDFGIVKVDTYNADKLTGYSQITSVKK